MIPGRLTRNRKCAHKQWRREPSCHRTPRYRCRNKNQDELRASLRQSQKPIYRWRREERSSACSEDRVRKKRRAELCLLPFRGQLFLMRPQLVERWWAAGHSERGQQGGDICERHGRIQCADKPKGGPVCVGISLFYRSRSRRPSAPCLDHPTQGYLLLAADNSRGPCTAQRKPLYSDKLYNKNPSAVCRVDVTSTLGLGAEHSREVCRCHGSTFWMVDVS